MNKFKRSVSFETDSESQPLLSSDSSNASFGANHQIMFPGSETSDFDQSQSYIDTQRNQQRNSPFSKLNLKSLPQNIKRTENTMNDLSYEKSIYTIPASLQSNSNRSYLTRSHIYAITHRDKYTEPAKPTKHHSQNSIVTIFSIWNTTMGTSLLPMAWGIQKAGFFPGIILILLLGALCLYTAYCCLQVSRDHGDAKNATDIPDLCEMLLGHWVKNVAKAFSIIVLLGAAIVYWVLMSNFLFHSVAFGIDEFLDKNITKQITGPGSVICPKNLHWKNITVFDDESHRTGTAYKIWNEFSTVPIFLGFIIFPFLNFQNPTFFTKFNCLGTISVFYLMVFVITKASIWGMNMHLDTEPIIKPTFTALTGMLSLSFFIHNIIISIIKNNRQQKNNGRDISIAFSLITFTYLIIGGIFYAAFPLVKSCIEDNMFNNFEKSDAMTLSARVLLLFQIITTYPLIAFMLRNNVFELFVTKNKVQDEEIQNAEANIEKHYCYKWIFLFNVILSVICILFACFLPKVGLLIRFTGALSGLVYIFSIPCVLKLVSLKKHGKLTTIKTIFFISIPLLGAFNLFSQFFI